MPIHKFTFLLIGFVTLLVCGCAQKTTVVLVPDPDGHVSPVQVSNAAGEQEISRADESTEVSGRQSRPSAPEIMSKEEIQAKFSRALAALPTRPEHFILYFQTDSTDLTAESQAAIPSILQSIKDRNSQDISVVGHTDTVGDRGYNMRLSKNRAQAVARLLIQQGVAPATVISTSHGKENPLVKTADNVSEPRNRRVEVIVR